MNLNTAIKLAPAARIGTTPTKGAAVDVSGLTGKCMLILNASATEGSGMTLDTKIQHSDTTTDGDFVDAGVAFTRVTDAAASHQVIEMDVDGFKKYIRAVDTLGGSSPFVTRSVELISKTAQG